MYRSARREFTCKLSDDGSIVKAIALGKLLKGNNIVVGDYVELERIEAGDEFKIVSVQERTNEVSRLSIRDGKMKIMASNVDILVIVTSVASPAFKRGVVDRLLVRASVWNIKPIVVFNKMDLLENQSTDICFESDRLKKLGVSCFEYSASNEQYKPKYLAPGRAELKEVLKGKTSILVGQSGVGKSSTINSLSDDKVKLKSGSVGRSSKGLHTTTWSEMVDCGSYTLVDCPGMRSLSLDDINADSMISHWPDLCSISGSCKFADCLHSKDSKGCAFNELPPSRDTELIKSRLESFRDIKEEISQTPEWQKNY